MDKKAAVELVKLKILSSYASLGIPPELAELDILLTKRATAERLVKEGQVGTLAGGLANLFITGSMLAGAGIGAALALAHEGAKRKMNKEIMSRLGNLAAMDIMQDTIRKLEEVRKKQKRKKVKPRTTRQVEGTGEQLTVA